MLTNRIARYLSTNNVLWQTSSSSKSYLAELRKKTGYTFANCKKALELHENDVAKAEAWLKEQAQSLGWSKAAKLQGRTVTQGLIGVAVDKNYGSLIEINCETDFVARNKQFRGLACTVASAVLKHTITLGSDDSCKKAKLESSALLGLVTSNGKSIGDHSALTIGNLGENIVVKRALCVSVPEDVCLAGYTHPAAEETSPISYGKYGALLAFRTGENHEEIGRQLCQHIIGLNPEKIGDPNVDEPNKVADDETTLIYQDFLLDPSITILDLLKETNTQILDFSRFAMGEAMDSQVNLDAVEVGG